MPEIHLRIVGKVQGVGFRWFVRDRAVALGLDGWVRNSRQGDVGIVARGEVRPERVDAALQRLGEHAAPFERRACLGISTADLGLQASDDASG